MALCVVVVVTTAAPTWLDNLNKKMDDLGSKIEDSKFVTRMDEKLAGWSERFDQRTSRLLGTEDRESLHEAVSDSVKHDATASHQHSWRSDRSNAVATINTGPAVVSQPEIRHKISTAIAFEAQSLTLVDSQLRAVTTSNIRAGPGTNFSILTTIPAGTQLTTIGKTREGWYLLAHNDVAFGYIHHRQVERRTDSPPQQSVLALDDENAAPTNSGKSALSGIDVESIDTKPTVLRAQAACRPVSIELTKSDQVERDQFDVCTDAKGDWAL